MKYDIFVSYRRTDRELVAQVVQRLEARGVGVWYDAEIEGGADWRETIVEALTDSDMLAIFFSEECNASRQLKKELAVADNLGKPVIPILIENTQPRGAYLYELADRNWIQAFPDPMQKIDELVDHLTVLAGKTEGGLAGAAPKTPAAPAEAITREKAPPPDLAAADNFAAPPPSPAPHAPAEADPAPPLDDLLASAPKGAAASPPRASDAYIGKKHQATARPLNDILPFRWIDLLFLIPMIGGFIWLTKADATFLVEERPLFEVLSIGLLCLALVGLYGALVFPVRYYLRRRSVWTALRNYTISSLILYGALVGAFLIGYSQGLFPDDRPSEVAIFFAGVWFVFAIIAFIIYGILGTQRALRNFRSNIRKI